MVGNVFSQVLDISKSSASAILRETTCLARRAMLTCTQRRKKTTRMPEHFFNQRNRQKTTGHRHTPITQRQPEVFSTLPPEHLGQTAWRGVHSSICTFIHSLIHTFVHKLINQSSINQSIKCSEMNWTTLN